MSFPAMLYPAIVQWSPEYRRETAQYGREKAAALQRGAVLREAKRHRASLIHCRQAWPTARGQMTLTLAIKRGRVTDITITNDTTDDPHLSKCVSSAIRGWRLRGLTPPTASVELALSFGKVAKPDSLLVPASEVPRTKDSP